MELRKTVTEPAREIPVAGEADVLVVGGGLAGVSAALAAARCGAKVILLEKSCVLGGLATLGYVCHEDSTCCGATKPVNDNY